MTYLILISLLALVIYFLNKVKTTFNDLREDIRNIERKIDLINNPQKPLENEQVTDDEKTIEIISVTSPTIEEDPKIIHEEKPEPITFESDKTTKPVEEKAIEKTISPEQTHQIESTQELSNLIEPISLEEEKEEGEKEPTLSFWEKFKEKNPDLEKFIGENLINKIGILILVLGISYFVKYAIDKDWINEPARVGIGILSGVLVMAVAHKLRKKYAAFSSVIVAGAISIFYFTIGIAFHDYHLFSQEVAFSIMVIITTFSALISLSYNRIELAVLSLIGGFAVPFMISTGEGNYIVLFSYIIILNIGILVLAYYKKWNLVNILAYIFTILLYGGWLFKDLFSETPHYIGAFVFGFIFYLIFILMNVINNIRTKEGFSIVQSTILASNTFLFYGAGITILSDFHPEFKGLFTTALALLNMFYAWILYKKFGFDKKIVYLLIGLTLTFITLAIPIQFEGNYITLFWAAEGVLLLWLSQKSKITSYKLGSVIVNGLMIISLIIDWRNFYNDSDLPLNIIINPIFITGIFSIFSQLVIYYLLKNETEKTSILTFTFNPIKYKKFIITSTFIISYLTGILEVNFQSNNRIENFYSSISFPILYHLIFFAVLAFILMKKKTDIGYKRVALIAIINIILFTFWFSNYPFLEYTKIVTYRSGQPISFYLHYFSLIITLYFIYIVYQLKNIVDFSFFNQRYFLWGMAFLITYIASSEIMLHGLVVIDSASTQLNSLASSLTDKSSVINFFENNAYEQISLAKIKIIKTAFPVLWGILAFLFLIIGIKKQIKTLRIIALFLLGITIVKLFTYDINNISETGKIIAFILLGILILIISFVYQKVKLLIIEENETDVSRNNTDETK